MFSQVAVGWLILELWSSSARTMARENAKNANTFVMVPMAVVARRNWTLSSTWTPLSLHNVDAAAFRILRGYVALGPHSDRGSGSIGHHASFQTRRRSLSHPRKDGGETVSPSLGPGTRDSKGRGRVESDRPFEHRRTRMRVGSCRCAWDALPLDRRCLHEDASTPWTVVENPETQEETSLTLPESSLDPPPRSKKLSKDVERSLVEGTSFHAMSRPRKKADLLWSYHVSSMTLNEGFP